MENYLVHHGIKGMHWGVRRYQPYASGAVKKGKEIGKAALVKPRNAVKKELSDQKRMRNAYKESKSMSDDELRKANSRFVAEQNYRNNVRRDIQDSRGSARKTVSKFGNLASNKVVTTTAAAAGGAAAAIILANNKKIGSFLSEKVGYFMYMHGR